MAAETSTEPVTAPDCKQNHRAALESGNYDERAGGALHCPCCGERIGQFRQ